MGSIRMERSVVSIAGCVLPLPCAIGTELAQPPSLGRHWFAPAGLLNNSHSLPYRISRKELSHLVGVWVQVTSRPLLTVSLPTPELGQPRPWDSSGAASGSTPFSTSVAPCVLPKVWPPTISAAVSSSFIAIRPKVSRISMAAATGSGLRSEEHTSELQSQSN